MASLHDRLPLLLGEKAAGQLEEYFGIRTVNDLVRYFPRKYSDAMTTRGEGEELDLEEGEHVTFVDEITKAEARWTNRQPKREYLVVTLGHRQPKVTATFFNAKSQENTARGNPCDAVWGGRPFQGHHAIDAPSFFGAGLGEGLQVTGDHRVSLNGIW